jgi:hypothetical protein
MAMLRRAYRLAKEALSHRHDRASLPTRAARTLFGGRISWIVHPAVPGTGPSVARSHSRQGHTFVHGEATPPIHAASHLHSMAFFERMFDNKRRPRRCIDGLQHDDPLRKHAPTVVIGPTGETTTFRLLPR